MDIIHSKLVTFLLWGTDTPAWTNALAYYRIHKLQIHNVFIVVAPVDKSNWKIKLSFVWKTLIETIRNVKTSLRLLWSSGWSHKDSWTCNFGLGLVSLFVHSIACVTHKNTIDLAEKGIISTLVISFVCGSLHARPYMHGLTCTALHTRPYMHGLTCTVIHEQPYKQGRTCTA